MKPSTIEITGEIPKQYWFSENWIFRHRCDSFIGKGDVIFELWRNKYYNKEEICALDIVDVFGGTNVLCKIHKPKIHIDKTIEAVFDGILLPKGYRDCKKWCVLFDKVYFNQSDKYDNYNCGDPKAVMCIDDDGIITVISYVNLITYKLNKTSITYKLNKESKTKYGKAAKNVIALLNKFNKSPEYYQSDPDAIKKLLADCGGRFPCSSINSKTYTEFFTEYVEPYEDGRICYIHIQYCRKCGRVSWGSQCSIWNHECLSSL